MLVNRDELALSEWMGEKLDLTWAEHPEPWTVEAAVVAELEPPFNLAEEPADPLHPVLQAARKRWRDAALAARS